MNQELEQCLELTFGELIIGDKYISFPPHGGFRTAHYTHPVFQKIDAVEDFPSDDSGGYNAVRVEDGTLAYFPETAHVIRIE